jgi:hypothetical protein
MPDRETGDRTCEAEVHGQRLEERTAQGFLLVQDFDVGHLSFRSA